MQRCYDLTAGKVSKGSLYSKRAHKSYGTSGTFADKDWLRLFALLLKWLTCWEWRWRGSSLRMLIFLQASFKKLSKLSF